MITSSTIKRTFWFLIGSMFCMTVISSCANNEVGKSEIMGSLNMGDPPIQATVEQNGDTRVLNQTIHTLQNAVIKLKMGNTTIKSDQIVFDGKTGAFKTDKISGQIRSSVVEIRAPSGPYDVGGDNARGTSKELVMHNAFFSTGQTKIEADKIHVTWF